MDVVAGVIELKPNSMEHVENWAATINERIDEAIATLRDEGVQLESWFHLTLDGKDYLLSYMRAESMEEAVKAVEKSEHDIDSFHNEFKKTTWLKGTKARLLVDLNNEGA